MKGFKGFIVAAVGLYVAGALQQALSPRMSIFGVEPEFMLIFLSCACLFMRRSGGTVLGFFTGVVQGALVGVNLMHFVISRTVTGFLAGWSSDWGYQPNSFVAAFVTAVLTIFSQLLLMFLAPPAGIARYLADTMGTAVYNGVLAVPVYALLRRILVSPGI